MILVEVMWICSLLTLSWGYASALRSMLVRGYSQDEVLQPFAAWALSPILDITSAQGPKLSREKSKYSHHIIIQSHLES